jgi:hypothetical protein
MLDQTQNLLPGSLASYQTSGFGTTKREPCTGASIQPSLDTSQDLQQLFWSIGDIPEQDYSSEKFQGTLKKGGNIRTSMIADFV